MKAKGAGQTNLFEGGKERLEKTSEFKRKVEQVIMEVKDQYSQTLLNEKNWAKRILIVIRREIEIRRRIEKLSSLKNLHTLHRWQIG
jgi:hypothetical protein